MNGEKYYMVMNLMPDINVRLWWGIVRANLTLTWAQGMIGACPVFDNRSDADNYANGCNGAIVVEVIKPTGFKVKEGE